MKQLAIASNDAGQRLDKFLKKAVPLLPHALLYKYVRLKRIKVNGKRCAAGQKLLPGDLVDLYIGDEFFATRELPFLAAPPEVEVVYEDENLLLVDKAPGLVVHEDNSGESDTLIHRIQHYLYQKGDYDPRAEHSFAPALCNRIDRNTGGIVMAAKTFDTLQVLSAKIRDREIAKKYLCIVHGVPAKKKALLKGFHTKDASANTVTISRQPVPGAKTALTRYRVLAEDREGDLSLLEVELLTGRTHQIRAHLAAIGHPLLGDAKYGLQRRNRDSGFRFQALCSYRLTFTFPTEAGHLDYLRGRTFTVRRVPFLDRFPGAGLPEL